MADDAFDLALAHYCRKAGLATADQVAQAMKLQARTAGDRKPLNLMDALVQTGAITQAQRDLALSRVMSQKTGIHELGNFKLLKKLGEGGMGAVYLAEDSKAGTKVALKVLPKQYATNDEFLKRFRREADAASRLKHPNIVGAHASGHDLGYHFYVMDYCEGESLDRRLARDTSLPWQTAADIILQAARALEYAHANGFIHRDIKPANLFLTKDGVAKLLDLGLSKRIVEESGLSFQTVSGAILGTPHYISPEQAAGEKHVDGRADLYSLGATFYHLLTGAPPFSGTSALEIIAKHVNAQLPNPQDLNDSIPDGVVHVIRKMMAKKPGDRYPDAAAVVADLEEVVRGGAPKTEALDPSRSTVAAPRRPRKPAASLRRAARKSKPSWIPWAAGVAVFLVAIVVVALRPSPQTPTPPPEPKKTASPAPLPPPTPAPAPIGSPVAPDIPEWAVIGPFPAAGDVDLDVRHPPDGALEFAKTYPGKDGPVSWQIVRPLGPSVDLILELGAAHKAVAYAVAFLQAPADASAVLHLGSDDACAAWLNDRKIHEARRDRSFAAGEDRVPIALVKGPNVLKLKIAQGYSRWAFGAFVTRPEGGPVPGLTTLFPASVPRRPASFDRAWIESLVLLPPAEQARKVEERLKKLNSGFTQNLTTAGDARSLHSITASAGKLSDASPFRALRGLISLQLMHEPPGGALTDLTPLHFLPLEQLSIHGSSVSDLSPLRGMALTELYGGHCPIRDIEPLRGMPLRLLALQGTRVRDLKPLEGMPLEQLFLGGTGVTELRPLRTLPRLRELSVDFDLARDGEHLRAIPSLVTLNGRPASEILKGQPRNLLAEGKSLDQLFGHNDGWRLTQGVLEIPAGRNCVATTRESFGDGEIRIRFEVRKLNHLNLSVRVSAPGLHTVFLPGASVQDGTHELAFSCRGLAVTATLDGQPVSLKIATGTYGGAIQLNASAESFRILAIEFRN